MDWYEELTIEQLPEPYNDIANIIGLDGAVKLFELQGRAVYFGRRSSDELATNRAELIKLIGLDDAKKIEQQYIGSYLYLRKVDELLREQRDEKIYNEFDGGNYGALATKYKLTERWVRDIVERKRKPIQHEQISFDTS